MKMNQLEVKNRYYYQDGELYFAESRGPRKRGDQVGAMSSRGKITKINQQIISVARVIYLYHNGYLPKCLTHLDGDPFNNKIENLAPITRSKINADSVFPKSGNIRTGIRKQVAGSYQVTISKDRIKYYIGSYPTIEDAIAARKIAYKILYETFKVSDD